MSSASAGDLFESESESVVGESSLLFPIERREGEDGEAAAVEAEEGEAGGGCGGCAGCADGCAAGFLEKK